ncbi:MAG TPA: hypothetical protein VER76_09930 [Pyrinomonadaceae bacterium]|nr:hypothetical protein [Pyrinomonadaceae bacterium]
MRAKERQEVEELLDAALLPALAAPDARRPASNDALTVALPTPLITARRLLLKRPARG